MSELIAKIAAHQNLDQYREQHWDGSFEDYLGLVRKNPKVTRNAFQRVYDMMLSYGRMEYVDSKKKLVHYPFFDDAENDGADAVYGLDIPLMRLVNVFKSAALSYGTEKRVILLHGPVGSSKSTIARRMKKGLELYAQKPEGALYTFDWYLDDVKEDGSMKREHMPCPMHEEPLKLIPVEWRPRVLKELALGTDDAPVVVEGELCPACRFVFSQMMAKYKGDFNKVIEHVKVHRLILSEVFLQRTNQPNDRLFARFHRTGNCMFMGCSLNNCCLNEIMSPDH